MKRVLMAIGALVASWAGGFYFGVLCGCKAENRQAVRWLRNECKSDTIQRAADCIEYRTHWREVDDG